MHLLGARLAQRPGALVDGRARRVDVVDERQRARSRARGERAAHVAAARRRVEPALRAHGARAADERHDRHAPTSARARAASSAGGSAPRSEQAVAHGGHDGDRIDRGRGSSCTTSAAARRPGEISPRFQRADERRAAGPSSQSAERAVVNQRRRAHARQDVDGEGGRRAAARAQRRRQRAQLRRRSASHIHSPGARHATQRRGSTRRTSEVSEGMRPG